MSARRSVCSLLALAVLVTACSSGTGRRRTHASSPRPNIVFLLTDDLDLPELAYMPNVARLLMNRGVTFTNYFVSNSLCCPSRSSILRGQYAHNTGIESNGDQNGGFETAYRLGIEKSTIGTWLHDAGYRTAYVGKYLNLYPDTASTTYVPPGWDEFDSAVAGTPYSEYNYVLNENQHLVRYGDTPGEYGTSVYLGKAQRFIRTTAGKPFFLYLNVYAPHPPATPALRDQHLFPDATAPRTPSFNLDPGKPYWVRQLRLGPRQIRNIDGLYRARIQSLQAVDRGVASLIDTLRATGQLANTYFVFSSDNGFHLGQFGLPAGKGTAYDTDIRVPLIVRGPGVPAARTSSFMIGNIDLAPTLAELAGVQSPDFVDGRSFTSLLHHPSTDSRPRHSYLLEHWRASRSQSFGSGPGPKEPSDLDNRAGPPAAGAAVSGVPIERPEFIPEFHGVRTENYMYVEYSKKSRELYATGSDPYEMHNLVSEPVYASLVARLHTLVAELGKCQAAVCRALENAAIPN